MKKGQVYANNCADCKLQKRSENCRKCHDYWESQYQQMFKAQAKANGAIGGLKSNLSKARSELQRSRAEGAVLRKTIKTAIHYIEISKRFEKKLLIQMLWNLLKGEAKK